MLQKRLLVVTILSLIPVLGIGGCASEEKIRTYGVAEISNEGVVSGKIVEEHITNGKKKLVQKQQIHEKVPCVDEDGQLIPVETVTECIKKKGKIVNESFLENSGIKNK